ncbi:MAG: hypothetical protein JWN86_1389 [Planctomycetota bacterium]|nr:hypothetical protein [Planctomycetota bacterium]
MLATIDLSDDVMAEAAQDFFASEWADAREEAGFCFAAGQEITDICPDQSREKLLGLIRPHVADLARAWGRGVGEMFASMEIPEDKWADALYYVLMGCRGHGVGLEDDYDDNIETARAKLGIEIDPSPFHSEFSEFADLAYEIVEAEALTPDTDPDPDDTFQPGERVRLDARMPSGDRLKGTGKVVRCCPPGEQNNAVEGVVVTMDEGEGIEPWSYSGRTVFVDAEECQSIG